MNIGARSMDRHGRRAGFSLIQLVVLVAIVALGLYIVWVRNRESSASTLGAGRG